MKLKKLERGDMAEINSTEDNQLTQETGLETAGLLAGEKKRALIVKIAMIVGAALIVIGGGWWLYQHFFTKSVDSEILSLPTLQSFTAVDCAKMTVCPLYDQNCETNGSTVTLRDERDNKTYRVRKFADNNCWMIDNLAYGGGVDGKGDYCLGRTTEDWRTAVNAEAVQAQAKTGLNGRKALYVGDCLDPAKGNDNACANGSITKCGYLYNWAAATQDPTAYAYNMAESMEPIEGICPKGWQLPTVEGDKSFYNLHLASGFNWDAAAWYGDGFVGFWQSPDQWNGVFSGLFFDDLEQTGLKGVGEFGNYWTSGQYTPGKSYIMNMFSEQVAPSGMAAEKNYGASVRCVLK